jgi:hypothetical protein
MLNFTFVTPFPWRSTGVFIGRLSRCFRVPFLPFAMASSSSNSFNSSTTSESSWEMTSEFDSKAAHEAYAPLHWDAEEWDFRAWSEDDESLTDGEDLQFLLDGELEDKDDDDDESWDGYDPSLEEEEDDELTEEDSTAGSFLCARSSNEDDDGDDGGDSDDGADSDDGSSSDDGAGDDGSDRGSGGSDVGASPPIKRRRFLGTY